MNKFPETQPPEAGTYVVYGIVRSSGRLWATTADWEYKPKYKPIIQGFSAGGLTFNAAVKITHWRNFDKMVGKYSDRLTFEEHEGDRVANLGQGDLAEGMGQVLVVLYAGYTVKKENGDVLYYNGACSNDGYKDLYDKVLSL